MKKRKLKMYIYSLFLVFLLLLFIVYHRCEIKIAKKYTYNCRVPNETVQKSEIWWDISYSADYYPIEFNSAPFVYERNILNKINYDKYNAILSYGHKIAKVEYIKDSRFFNILPLKSGAVKVYMEPKFDKEKLYIYLIAKNKKISNDYKISNNSKTVIIQYDGSAYELKRDRGRFSVSACFGGFWRFESEDREPSPVLI